MSTVQHANGRWRDLLGRFGVAPSFLTGKHGPCPLCGGRDRFRFDNKRGRGTWFCNQCGAGDGFTLLERMKGWDFKKACEEVEGVVGKAKKESVSSVCSDDFEANKMAMAAKWALAMPLRVEDEVMLYLASRGITIKPSQIKDVRCGSGEMLSVYRDVSGVGKQLHRTVFDPKRKLFSRGTIPLGGAVRLMDHGEVLGIAEGIENALSAYILGGIPCWAALNAHLLENWQPPNGVKYVSIYADNDLCASGFAGQAAAYILARRLSKDYSVKVFIPPHHKDWNEVLQGAAPTRA